MSKQITLEELLELVTVERISNGKWRIVDVKGNVYGDVGGSVCGDVDGSVIGTVFGNASRCLRQC